MWGIKIQRILKRHKLLPVDLQPSTDKTLFEKNAVLIGDRLGVVVHILDNRSRCAKPLEFF